MTSTIKVDNIQDQDGNNIINENANTITIGASGDTVTLASGASQSGFGRTGTVDWDTTAKTASFTAVSGNGYFVNTTSGAITVTLPVSPNAGDIVAVSDYAQTSATNNITIARNGSNIQGDASDLVLARNGVAMTLVYVDATKGWIVTDTGAEADKEPDVEFVSATGGTVTTSPCGDFKIHTFTGPGTFTVTSAGNSLGSNSVDYLVVAGGGGGAGGVGGGGGAGGFRLSNSYSLPAPTTSPLANPTGIEVTATAFPITVGAGGAGAPAGSPEFSGTQGCNGANSVFSTITSAGGGGGARRGACQNAGNGGSGGGGAGEVPSPGSQRQGGSGNTPPVSPSQGNDGGIGGIAPANRASGGGGGAAAAGGGACGTQCAGDGGIGTFVSPSFAVSCAGTTGPVPSVRYFAGGGGGGVESAPPLGLGSNGAGGAGGGGGGGPGPTAIGSGVSGTTNTGGGGGGASRYNCSPSRPATRTGGSGGSGIVIIRYKFQ